MKIEEPLIILINKHKPFAFFKIEHDKVLAFNGVQTLILNDDTNNEDHFIVLSGDDVIPFVLVHNMRMMTTIQILKNEGKGGKHHLITIVKEAVIENELNTDLTVEDVYNDYDNDIITYDELYIWLILETQRKHK